MSAPITTRRAFDAELARPKPDFRAALGFVLALRASARKIQEGRSA